MLRRGNILNSKFNSKIILIGGTSHTGKSTLGKSIATGLNIDYLATDRLARHPGRPWKPYSESIPEHVQKHYSSLDTGALLESVLLHYRKLASDIVELVNSYRSTSRSLVLEGSALLPELMSEVANTQVHPVILHADDDFITSRIYANSDYSNKNQNERHLIDQFAQRSLAFNEVVTRQAEALHLPSINIKEFPDNQVLMDKCLELLCWIKNHVK